MLTLLQPRCTLHSPQLSLTRTLRTLPREIPTYIKRWDPTLYRPIPQRTASREDTGVLGQTSDDSPQARPDRSALEHAVTYTKSKGGILERRHAFKVLEHLVKQGKSINGLSILHASLRAPLWRAYVLSKAVDPELICRLTKRTWNMLWSTQSANVALNRNREAHLKQLQCDMRLASRHLTVHRRVEQLEQLFLGGKEEQAVEEWEDDNKATGPAQPAKKPEHLEMGTKLYALAGHVDKARDTMEELYRLYPGWDAAVMMTVFRAHTSSPVQKERFAASSIYKRMRKQKGEETSIADYDAWLVGFLEARDLQHAKQVFRHMVKDGNIATGESVENIGEVLKRLHLLYRLGNDISTMTSIALDAISVLPPAYHGHLFGDWMKVAVIKKAPEAAAQILDMMIQRGYKPQTIHFNMLLKALFRTQDTPNILKAENIGWRMIDETRKTDLRKRRSRTTAERISTTPNNPPDFRLKGNHTLPPGDVTTFALIMQHHAKSLQWEHVEYLDRQLKSTSIIPNATILNVLMDNKCRQGFYSEAWNIYKQLTEPHEGEEGVYPNGASLRILWKTLRLALSNQATRSDFNLPTPRALLNETVTWWSLCRSRYDASRFQQGLAGADSGAITALMMHCFSFTEDLPGALIALHVLRHRFHIFPTDKATQILQRQMSWVDLTRESDAVRSQHFHNRNFRKNAARIARVHDILLQKRLARTQALGRELSEEQIGDVRLNLLSELVRVVLKRSFTAEEVEARIDAARCEVGLPMLETGDMNAWEVA